MNKFLAKRNLKTPNENVKIWGEKQSQYSPFNCKTTECVGNEIVYNSYRLL